MAFIYNLKTGYPDVCIREKKTKYKKKTFDSYNEIQISGSSKLLIIS